MRRLVALLACPFVLCPPATAAPEPELWLTPPVDGAVVARFEAPVRKWGSGHRGVDYAVAAGTAVRAAASGTVTFAGSVAGTLAVTIDHGPFQTTYSALSSVDVTEGQFVDRGHWIGAVGEAHEGTAGLHLGVKDGDAYLDPARFFGPVDASAAIHLAPVVDRRIEDIPDSFHPFALWPGDHERDCIEHTTVEPPTVPPNDNVVVVINGLGSRTAGPADSVLYRHAVDLLRYPAERAYTFSYVGMDGDRLHEPYGPSATYGDLGVAATKLHALLRAVGERHPGADVDLLAHSQGGLIARLFLQRLRTSWVPGLPHVDHLVTLATPHTGAPAADVVARMEDSLVGGAINDVLSEVSRDTGAFPDPHGEVIEQLSPSSEVQAVLAREDVAYGTRVLALGVPDDLAVPAQRARLQHEQSLTLPPAGGFAHSGILESDRAASVAHDFLRDAAPSCPGAWDDWGPRLGRVIELVEDGIW